MIIPLFYSCHKLARLKGMRKKTLQNLKKIDNQDPMVTHSYRIMIDVIDKKMATLAVNK